MATPNEVREGERMRVPGRLTRPSRVAMASIVMLVTITGAAIAFDMLAWKGRKTEEIRTFQKAVGGLGMGAIATPLWQFMNYDERVLSVDDSITWPVPGVSHAAPRVVGRTYFVDRLVAVVGEGIVRVFGVKPGPGMRFTLAANNRKVFVPTGTLAPSCLWGSEILIMHIDDANAFFRMKDRASHHLLYEAQGAKTVSSEPWERVKEMGLLGVEGRKAFEGRLKAGYGNRGGIFIVLFVIGAVLTVPAIVVTSGFGLREVGKEIGILKATGWRTKDVLEKVLLQNLMICLTAVCLSILFSMGWMKGLNGALIAQFYIAEIGLFPDLDVPSRYLPSHALLSLAFSMGGHRGRRPCDHVEDDTHAPKRVDEMNAMDAVIKTEHISKWYHRGRSDEVRAVDDVSLEIFESQSAVLCGPSGSGKTTLLGLIGTIDRPTGGRMVLYGRNITLFSDLELSRIRRETIGIVFQSFHLFSGMSAWENVSPR